jgi:hypothetical protein
MDEYDGLSAWIACLNEVKSSASAPCNDVIFHGVLRFARGSKCPRVHIRQAVLRNTDFESKTGQGQDANQAQSARRWCYAPPLVLLCTSPWRWGRSNNLTAPAHVPNLGLADFLTRSLRVSHKGGPRAYG